MSRRMFPGFGLRVVVVVVVVMVELPFSSTLMSRREPVAVEILARSKCPFGDTNKSREMRQRSQMLTCVSWPLDGRGARGSIRVSSPPARVRKDAVYICRR